MFKKMLANLPFDPSLLEKLVFYSKKVKHEAGLRKAGFWLLALTLTVQAGIALYTPAATSDPAVPLIVGFILAVIAGFLYARSRIIALELEIIRLSYITAGGM
ncbi:MAG TPA: hypothetical protein VLE51_00455 [Candidatus Saccharimonadales bacterium]|nr:hypothetical protein [Candidatus Saccharimonadales bacterium]